MYVHLLSLFITSQTVSRVTQSHSDTIKTPSRHRPDTPQTPENRALFCSLEATGSKGNSLIWRHMFNCLWFIWHLNSPRHLPDTSRYDPDTHRHNPDTPRHRRFYAIQGTGKRAISEYHDLKYFLPRDLVLHTQSKHHPDTLRHPQTPFTHPQTCFYAIDGTRRKGNIRQWHKSH